MLKLMSHMSISFIKKGMAREGNSNWKSTNNQDVKQQMQLIRLCLGLPVTTPLVST